MTIVVYRLTQSFPREETYGLTGQLRRSAVSIPSNIAEGQGRLNTREFKQFLGIARALGLGDRQLLNEAESLSHEIGKMIFAILGKLKARTAVH